MLVPIGLREGLTKKVGFFSKKGGGGVGEKTNLLILFFIFLQTMNMASRLLDSWRTVKMNHISTGLTKLSLDYRQLNFLQSDVFIIGKVFFNYSIRQFSAMPPILGQMSYIVLLAQYKYFQMCSQLLSNISESDNNH